MNLNLHQSNQTTQLASNIPSPTTSGEDSTLYQPSHITPDPSLEASARFCRSALALQVFRTTPTSLTASPTMSTTISNTSLPSTMVAFIVALGTAFAISVLIWRGRDVMGVTGRIVGARGLSADGVSLGKKARNERHGNGCR